MSDSLLINTMVGKLLDWPFLLFILVFSMLYKFRTQIAAWMQRVTEVELSKGKLKFKIGKDEVPLDKLDTMITAHLRELQEEIDRLRNTEAASRVDVASRWITVEDEIPSGLQALLVDRVYAMLGSKLWLGRYVGTLAKATSVSEDLMHKFLKSRDDIGPFKDGDRWVAALSDRLTTPT